jgi:hypothetical protein
MLPARVALPPSLDQLTVVHECVDEWHDTLPFNVEQRCISVANTASSMDKSWMRLRTSTSLCSALALRDPTQKSMTVPTANDDATRIVGMSRTTSRSFPSHAMKASLWSASISSPWLPLAPSTSIFPTIWSVAGSISNS